jgi:ABC-type nickel/cobalt efflux system permease component RcnA
MLFMLVFILMDYSVFSHALAQTQSRGPFGLGERPAAPPSGLVGWLLARQAEFHKTLVSALSQARTGGGAWLLISSGFLYGIFHAAGPGHGKAVVSSYVLANERALRRGVVIAFAAAVIQALIAVFVVFFALSILETTARQIDGIVRSVEIVSFTLIALFGLGLTIRKGRAFYKIWTTRNAPAGDPSCAECGQFRLSYRPSNAAAAAPACGHVVIPQASDIAGEKSVAELAAIAFAAGSRPCTGAILILVLAWSAGIFAIGIAATFAMALGTAIATSGFALAAGGTKMLASKLADRSERLRPVVAALELVAAIVVLLLGVSLLLGYLSGD